MTLCVSCVCKSPEGPEESMRSPETEITGTQSGCWRLEAGPLQEF